MYNMRMVQFHDFDRGRDCPKGLNLIMKLKVPPRARNRVYTSPRPPSATYILQTRAPPHLPLGYPASCTPVAMGGRGRIEKREGVKVLALRAVVTVHMRVASRARARCEWWSRNSPARALWALGRRGGPARAGAGACCQQVVQRPRRPRRTCGLPD